MPSCINSFSLLWTDCHARVTTGLETAIQSDLSHSQSLSGVGRMCYTLLSSRAEVNLATVDK